VESLQLILRRQVLWLVHQKGHKEELETVVRDLWDLRIRNCPSITERDSTSDGELSTFSSQSVATTEAETSAGSFSKTLSWDPERGSDWPMPRLIESLVICYLGCQLLRIPTRIGDFHRWAIDGQICYENAVWYKLDYSPIY
jgi:RNA polymerase I-specific transcription initiation factor RRN7